MRKQSFGLVALCLCLWSLMRAAEGQAEWYVAGQAGINFADQLTNVQGTGRLLGQVAPDFDLKNAVAYGGKLGYFPGHGSVGLELDVLNSQPNIKNLDNVPGIHLQVTNIGIHILLRYPGETFQPYAGIGPAILVSRIGNSPTTRSDSDVGLGIDVLGGLRTFITPYVAVFTEYKFTRGSLTFDDAFGSVGGFSGTYRAQQLMVGVSYHF